MADGVHGQRLRTLFEGLPTPYLITDTDHVIVDANAAYCASISRSLESMVGRGQFEVFPPAPADLDEEGVPFVLRSIDRVVATGEPDEMPLLQYDIENPATGEREERWWSLVHFPVLDADGVVVLLAQQSHDVTDLIVERRRTAELADRAEIAEAAEATASAQRDVAIEAERLAARRVASLAAVALDLAGAGSVTDVRRSLELGLEVLGADGGAVTVSTADGWRLVVNAGLGPEVEEQFGLLPHDSPLPGPHVGRTGKPLLLLSRESALAYDADVMPAIWEGTGRTSWAFLPLEAGGELLGVLSTCWPDERPLTIEELALLDGFAAQVAQVLLRFRATAAERALAARAQELSETLQRSLLTRPPERPGLEIAVRYQPAAQEAQVGGDWYDAFTTRSGGTLLVVGDVSGHDRTAAAMMGQVRNLLRGLAYDSGHGPAVLLSRLDQAMLGLDLEGLATCVLGSVALDDEGARLRLSNAGHPPAVLRRADGSVDVLDEGGDLLLGLDPSFVRAEVAIDLEPGSVLVLYTDGLVERRDASIEDGIARVARALRDAVDTEPEQLADALLDVLAGGRGEDDVALLVARVAP